MEVILNGIGVSPGIAIGPTFSFRVRHTEVPKYGIEDTAAEMARFAEAVDTVRADLVALKEKTEAELDAKHAAIFDAHLLILEDVTLLSEVQSRLEAEKLNIEYIVDSAIKHLSGIFERLTDPTYRERGLDVRDVGRRIVERLLHLDNQDLHNMGDPSIVVAHDLTPSDTANLDLPNTLALASDLGGATSHTAILARAFELPAVVGLKRVGLHAYPNDMIIVDGNEGVVIVRPEPATIALYTEKQAADRAQHDEAIESSRFQESITVDGVRIPLRLNIELPAEIERGMKVNPEGIGLFRTEFLFLNRTGAPSEEEQYQIYSKALESVSPGGVTFRTLDLGGDKFARDLNPEDERNPQLGFRAIRFCLERTDIFRAQLRALYRASAHGQTSIMFPLVSGIGEWRRAQFIAKDVQEELADDGIAFRRDVPLGIMIEVPSAVLMADMFAKECDFFSIGTNDLVQYTLAVDRVNERIAHLFEPAHPAILRSIAQTVRAAKAENIPVTICGEMGGNPVFTELLLGLGVDSLSMSSVSIPEVRAAVSNVNIEEAKVFAEELLNKSTGAEVKRALRKRFGDTHPVFWHLSQFDRAGLENDDENTE